MQKLDIDNSHRPNWRPVGVMAQLNITLVFVLGVKYGFFSVVGTVGL